MDFVLTVHLDNVSGNYEHEVARILRYWAGALKNEDILTPGNHMNIYDSSYTKVGCWDVLGELTDVETKALDESNPAATIAAPPETPEPPAHPEPADLPELPETPTINA